MIIRSKTLRENIIYGSERALLKIGDRDAIDARIDHVMEQVNIKQHFNNKDKFPQGQSKLHHITFHSIISTLLMAHLRCQPNGCLYAARSQYSVL